MSDYAKLFQVSSLYDRLGQVIWAWAWLVQVISV